VVVSVLLALSLLGNLVLFVAVVGIHGTESSLVYESPFLEVQLPESDPHARDKIAVISLTGIITMSSDNYPSEEGLVGWMKGQLHEALEDRRVKAIILRINSPGGEVVASDMIYRAVVAARERKPVIACIDSVGASGAYYVAVGADHILATDLTITGSIGVILQTLTFADLMGKIGIKSFTFKSGRYKDLLNPTRDPTAEEQQLVQDLVMEVYEKFVGIVAAERELAVADLKDGLADGRILSGRQAVDAGLVDELGYFEDAIAKAKELAGLDKARVVRYRMPFSLFNLLRFFGKQDRARVTVDLTPQPLHLETGKLYYLPAYLFQ